jgi:hypothetical protein
VAVDHAGSVAITPTVVQAEVNAGEVLAGLSELGLIQLRNGDA